MTMDMPDKIIVCCPAVTIMDGTKELNTVRMCLTDKGQEMTGEGYVHFVKSDLAQSLADALQGCLDQMESDRASGDSGYWDWEDGDVYSNGQAALANYRKGE